MEHVRHWFDSMMAGLETVGDEETRKRLLEHCGRACARRETIAAVKKGVADATAGESRRQAGDGPAVQRGAAAGGGLDRLEGVDAVITMFNKALRGQGTMVREGEMLTLTYHKCFCPMRKEGLSSPTLCDCTRGWAKEVFETAAGHPVQAELVSSINRGSDACRIRVHL